MKILHFNAFEARGVGHRSAFLHTDLKQDGHVASLLDVKNSDASWRGEIFKTIPTSSILSGLYLLYCGELQSPSNLTWRGNRKKILFSNIVRHPVTCHTLMRVNMFGLPLHRKANFRVAKRGVDLSSYRSRGA